MTRKLFQAWCSLWKIRGEISKRLYFLMVLLSISIPLLGWACITYSGWVDNQFLPSPTTVLARGYTSLQSGELVADLIASLSRVIWGFLASAILSIPLGLIIGAFKSMQGLLEPILGLLRYMPTAAFIPLIILWIGIDEPSKIAIIFLGTFFYNVLMIADAVKFIPSDLIKVSYTLGAKEKDIFFDVIFPATLPHIIDTLRINIATAWNFVVIAELIAASSGLGYRILMAQRAYQTDAIFVGIIVIGLVGLLIDFSFKSLFNLVVPWATDKNH
ncbi:ABC transporter permease [Trichocoleus sp. FACHB-591]|uniref:ABC transporter permease n=1 Tax=Trichocoleus sp. FACHB-591 TaxID=2692872 RepID=UPI0016825E83|nr:ABC transporter permease [Trichocoleus sp. FACHB-591]MBD2094810.1 ABC transporter permease [Trichocoleus sp. FACHB-591]